MEENKTDEGSTTLPAVDQTFGNLSTRNLSENSFDSFISKGRNIRKVAWKRRTFLPAQNESLKLKSTDSDITTGNKTYDRYELSFGLSDDSVDLNPVKKSRIKIVNKRRVRAANRLSLSDSELPLNKKGKASNLPPGRATLSSTKKGSNSNATHVMSNSDESSVEELDNYKRKIKLTRKRKSLNFSLESIIENVVQSNYIGDSDAEDFSGYHRLEVKAPEAASIINNETSSHSQLQKIDSSHLSNSSNSKSSEKEIFSPKRGKNELKNEISGSKAIVINLDSIIKDVEQNEKLEREASETNQNLSENINKEAASFINKEALGLGDSPRKARSRSSIANNQNNSNEEEILSKNKDLNVLNIRGSPKLKSAKHNLDSRTENVIQSTEKTNLLDNETNSINKSLHKNKNESGLVISNETSKDIQSPIRKSPRLSNSPSIMSKFGETSMTKQDENEPKHLSLKRKSDINFDSVMGNLVKPVVEMPNNKSNTNTNKENTSIINNEASPGSSKLPVNSYSSSNTKKILNQSQDLNELKMKLSPKRKSGNLNMMDSITEKERIHEVNPNYRNFHATTNESLSISINEASLVSQSPKRKSPRLSNSPCSTSNIEESLAKNKPTAKFSSKRKSVHINLDSIIENMAKENYIEEESDKTINKNYKLKEMAIEKGVTLVGETSPVNKSPKRMLTRVSNASLILSDLEVSGTVEENNKHKIKISNKPINVSLDSIIENMAKEKETDVDGESNRTVGTNNSLGAVSLVDETSLANQSPKRKSPRLSNVSYSLSNLEVSAAVEENYNKLKKIISRKPISLNLDSLIENIAKDKDIEEESDKRVNANNYLGAVSPAENLPVNQSPKRKSPRLSNVLIENIAKDKDIEEESDKRVNTNNYFGAVSPAENLPVNQSPKRKSPRLSNASYSLSNLEISAAVGERDEHKRKMSNERMPINVNLESITENMPRHIENKDIVDQHMSGNTSTVIQVDLPNLASLPAEARKIVSNSIKSYSSLSLKTYITDDPPLPLASNDFHSSRSPTKFKKVESPVSRTEVPKSPMIQNNSPPTQQKSGKNSPQSKLDRMKGISKRKSLSVSFQNVLENESLNVKSPLYIQQKDVTTALPANLQQSPKSLVSKEIKLQSSLNIENSSTNLHLSLRNSPSKLDGLQNITKENLFKSPDKVQENEISIVKMLPWRIQNTPSNVRKSPFEIITGHPTVESGLSATPKLKSKKLEGSPAINFLIRRNKLAKSNPSEMEEEISETIHKGSNMGENLRQPTLKEFLEKMSKGNASKSEKKPSLLVDLFKKSETVIPKKHPNVKRPSYQSNSIKKKEIVNNLSLSTNEKTFKHYSKHKVTKKAVDVMHQVMGDFFLNLSSDLQVVLAAKKEDSISTEHIYLLMKEVGLVSSKEDMYSKLQETLPVNEWIKVVPTKFANNKILPDSRKK